MSNQNNRATIITLLNKLGLPDHVFHLFHHTHASLTPHSDTNERTTKI